MLTTQKDPLISTPLTKINRTPPISSPDGVNSQERAGVGQAVNLNKFIC